MSISNCWGNMLMSMLLGAIIAVMVMKCMGRKKRMAWVKEKKTFQKLISTIILTIPGIGNIAILLFLAIYIFTVIAVNLFAKVEYNGYYNSDLNFRSFSKGFLLD